MDSKTRKQMEKLAKDLHKEASAKLTQIEKLRGEASTLWACATRIETVLKGRAE